MVDPQKVFIQNELWIFDPRPIAESPCHRGRGAGPVGPSDGIGIEKPCLITILKRLKTNKQTHNDIVKRKTTNSK